MDDSIQSGCRCYSYIICDTSGVQIRQELHSGAEEQNRKGKLQAILGEVLCGRHPCDTFNIPPVQLQQAEIDDSTRYTCGFKT